MSADDGARGRSPAGAEGWRRFARGFVHEVRSPLNALLIYLELLGREEGAARPPGSPALTARSRDQALRIEEYLKTFLVLWAAPSEGDADLAELLRAALVIASHECRRCGCTLESTLPERLPVAVAPAGAADLLVRLLSAAIAPGRAVQVTLETDGVEARLTVRAPNLSVVPPPIERVRLDASPEAVVVSMPCARGT